MENSIKSNSILGLYFRLPFLFCFFWGLTPAWGVSTLEFTGDSRILRMEVEDDQTLHLEYLPLKSGCPLGLRAWNSLSSLFGLSYHREEKIDSSPMVEKKDFAGPSDLFVHGNSGNVITTPKLVVTVVPSSLCVSVYDREIHAELLEVCASDGDGNSHALEIHPRELENIYGMGNYPYESTTSDGDWSGKDWIAEGFGNSRHYFLGGAPTVSQFPVLYALGKGLKNVALFFDNPRQINWNFRDSQHWKISSPSESLRFYILTGSDLKSLRRQFMQLVGKPLVPPLSTFGLWVSKFGYSGWEEIQAELGDLRKKGFPVDGFALDIQWFGGRFDDSSAAHMGSLTFDPTAFSSPELEIARFREKEGIHFMAIEESYVDIRLPEFQNLRGNRAENCYLARRSYQGCDPVQLGSEQNPLWWGTGGMIDWTHPEAGQFWHQKKRMPLAKMGIQHHWTDLGEPEMFDPEAYYHGVEPVKNRHWDVHNLYNLMWSQSIHQGYTQLQNQEELQSSSGLPAPPRYFSMSRAGAPGMQRFGGGMWSGDIGRNAGSLRAQLNTQLHMSLAGMDYYNSDVGGFMDTGVIGSEPGANDSELYTQWFASSALGEIPLRPHGWAYGEEGLSFGPHVRGDVNSNRANLLRRYELAPYLYSLAHRAYRFGDPIFPPLVYEFQEDLNVRQIGNEKMIGDFLLYGVVVGFGQTERTVYLPRGTWINYNTWDWFESQGENTPSIPVYLKKEGKFEFTLPLFARAGAIIPKRNIEKKPSPFNMKVTDDELLLEVFAGTEPTQFTHYEDDGETLAYQDGRFFSTDIHQILLKSNALKFEKIHISPTEGDYEWAPKTRSILIDLIVNQWIARSATLNGEVLPQCRNQAEWDLNTQGCWWNAGRNRIRLKSKPLDIRLAKDFQIDLR